MKVVLVNGSPHAVGCTYTALSIVAKALGENGVETEILQIGSKPVHGCQACGKCRELGKCVFDGDMANTILEAMKEADGVVFGTPVYFAGANGALCALLDRVYYAGGRHFKGMPGAAIASCRRAGSTAALDRLNKYLTYNQMVVVASQYWNMVHGSKAEDVMQDEEGVQTMRILGNRMAWTLKNLEAGGVEPPAGEKHIFTNFVR